MLSPSLSESYSADPKSPSPFGCLAKSSLPSLFQLSQMLSPSIVNYLLKSEVGKFRNPHNGSIKFPIKRVRILVSIECFAFELYE